MLRRCSNPRARGYDNYGGRGIQVTPEWQGREGFQKFIAYIGLRPDGHTLDRIDGDGHYEPGNVRWAQRDVQVRNRRITVWLTISGERLCLSDWLRRAKLPRTSYYRLLKSGRSPEQIIREALTSTAA